MNGAHTAGEGASDKLFALVGATGLEGGATASALLATGARVRMVVRGQRSRDRPNPSVLSGYGIHPDELDHAIRMLRCTPPTKGATMATDTFNDRVAYNLELMKRGDDAFNSRDVAGMNAIHHPDMIAHVMGNAEPIHGRAAHAAIIEQMIHIFPDVHVNNDPYPIQFGTGDWITVVTRATGTFSGEMILSDGNVIPPTGKSFDLDFATTARWEGDQLVEEYVFWDSALQAQQVGLA